MTSWLIGDGLWDLAVARTGDIPAVSVADVFYLIGYPLLASGIALMIRRRSQGRWQTPLFDAVGLASAALVATWAFLIDGASNGSVLARTVAAGYPLGDVVLFGAVAWLVLSPGRRSTASTLFVVAIGSILLTDLGLAIGLQISPNLPRVWLDNSYCFEYLLLGVLSMHPRVDELTTPGIPTPERLHPIRLVYLGVALFVVPFIGAFAGKYTTTPLAVIFVVTGATGVAVMFRLVQLLAEVQRTQLALTRAAATDELTDLHNRRGFFEVAERLVAHAAAERTTLAALMLDVDHFKRINDEQGHAVGDEVLREIAHRCRISVRPGDEVCRLGGDEFVLLLPDCGEQAAFEVATRIAERVRATPVQAADGLHPVTVSVGVGWLPGTPDLDGLLLVADAALYAAKAHGRDTVGAAPRHASRG